MVDLFVNIVWSYKFTVGVITGVVLLFSNSNRSAYCIKCSIVKICSLQLLSSSHLRGSFKKIMFTIFDYDLSGL